MQRIMNSLPAAVLKITFKPKGKFCSEKHTKVTDSVGDISLNIDEKAPDSIL
jgi:hypothetical protein